MHPETSSTPSVASGSEAAGYRVVIADDEPALRQMLCLLVDRDARVEVVAEAADGEHALRAVEEHDPDVLILDLAMPVMDGLEVLGALQGRARPRTVVLTGFDDPDVLASATSLGARACVVKGTGFDTLLDVVAEAAQP